MRQLKIIPGKLGGAMKVVIYGPKGIGKSTLAAKFPRPLFIDTEGSTRHMDVQRTERPTSWAMLLELVRCIKADPGLCSTLVIDTADWAEQLCITSICDSKRISGIEDMGYGKGYVYVAEEFGRLLNLLEEAVDNGIHVVLTAHAMMRKFEQPDEMGAYDRWELKLQKKTAALVKEWADLLLFANYKTLSVAVDDKGKKFKPQGGPARHVHNPSSLLGRKEPAGPSGGAAFGVRSIGPIFGQCRPRVTAAGACPGFLRVSAHTTSCLCQPDAGGNAAPSGQYTGAQGGGVYTESPARSDDATRCIGL